MQGSAVPLVLETDSTGPVLRATRLTRGRDIWCVPRLQYFQLWYFWIKRGTL